mmetsp:Transcript_17903/g.40596  ORF Transcript_17903/g.40596 Transcript_17903/m.40596 type:complete len:219 (+) Transcript_17903:74-730(+)
MFPEHFICAVPLAAFCCRITGQSSHSPAFPLIVSFNGSPNTTASLQIFLVVVSHRIFPRARCIRRADRFTASPIIVYSHLCSLPMIPMNTLPVATPMLHLHCAMFTCRCICNAASAARTASFPCVIEGIPKPARRLMPLSSTLSLFKLPPYLCRMSCRSTKICCASTIDTPSSILGRFTNTTVTRRSSFSHPSCPASIRAWHSIGMKFFSFKGTSSNM